MFNFYEGYGAGAPPGLQNQRHRKGWMEAAVMGSIPITPLHALARAADVPAREVFGIRSPKG